MRATHSSLGICFSPRFSDECVQVLGASCSWAAHLADDIQLVLQGLSRISHIQLTCIHGTPAVDVATVGDTSRRRTCRVSWL